MNILIVCSKSPYPPKEGGSLAMFNIITGLLKKGHKVKVLAVSTPKLKVKENELPIDFFTNTRFESCFINTTPSFTGALFNLFSTKSYHVSRFESNLFAEKLENILEQEPFDIVQLESLFVTPYIEVIRKKSQAKIVLRAHNIEHIIWQRVASTEKNFLKKIYLNIQAKRLKKYELNAADKVDGIATITEKDKSFFMEHSKNTPSISIPFGIEEKVTHYKNENREFPSLFFLGSLNWIPNTDGLKWFIDNVWEKISKMHPELPFYIAGRHVPPWLKNLNKKNIFVIGEVEDALEFMSSKMIMIVPLLSGSGMRVKIIESMYASNAIISTAVGAEGIDYTQRKDILIADTPEAFVSAMSTCTENKDLCIQIGENAQKLIKAKYINDNIIVNLIDFYKTIHLKK